MADQEELTPKPCTCMMCGFKQDHWSGRCPNCKEWSTMMDDEEETDEKNTNTV